MTTSIHPIRLLLHGFTKPVNNSIAAICAYPDAPDQTMLINGSERDMLYQQHKWYVAGQPNNCLWFPRENLFSLGFNL